MLLEFTICLAMVAITFIAIYVLKKVQPNNVNEWDSLKGTMTKGDYYFKKNIEEIISSGNKDVNPRPKWHDGTPAHTLFTTQRIESYDISKGECPLTTVKPTAWKSAINEMFVIYQEQSSSLEAFHKHKVMWWDEWESKDIPGTIGNRYGYVVKKYDLINKLIKELKEDPYGRRHNMNLNQYVDLESSDGLHSCAYETLWSVRDGGYLDCTLIQRSNDVCCAYDVNNVQYVALLMMIAKASGLKPGVFTRFVQNMHIYDRHIEIAKEYLNREPVCPNARLVFEPKSDNFYEFTIDDFRVEEYEPHKRLKAELAI